MTRNINALVMIIGVKFDGVLSLSMNRHTTYEALPVSSFNDLRQHYI